MRHPRIGALTTWTGTLHGDHAALLDFVRTVHGVTCVCSKTVPGGHLVVADVPDDARVVVKMSDEDEPRDITEWCADLILLGLGARQEREDSGAPAPQEAVQIAVVTVDGADPADLRLYYIHHPSMTVVPLDAADALESCALGVAHQVTAGVAHDEAEAAMADTDTPPDFSTLPTVGPTEFDLPPGS